MSLPTLCDPVTVRAMLTQETAILDLAATVLSGPIHGDHDNSTADLLKDHVAAIAHINELAFCHESDHPADRILHDSAMQLKAWHLCAIDTVLPL